MSKAYKYTRENTKLLTFHMQDVNPSYLFQHAIIAGKLAKREFNTYAEYVAECNRQGCSSYNEACFNSFMEEAEW